MPDINKRLDVLIEGIDSTSLRDAMSDLFAQLVELLDYLSLLETSLNSDEMLSKSHLIFKLLSEKGFALVDFIETKAKFADGITDSLYALLDSTSFAIHHELERTSNLPVSLTDQTIDKLRSDVARAHGLLLNCFQQSVISLAVEFDPSITGQQLFNDFKLKLDQSVVLLEALTILTDQVDRAEKVRDLDSYFALIEGLKMFGQGYIQYLMYRDWAEFETMSKKIANARTEYELWPLLHQFARYLETLVGHVRMRSVLQRQPHEHLV